jgi:hypothetical protein
LVCHRSEHHLINIRKNKITLILEELKEYSISSKVDAEFGARDLAFTLGRVYAASLLIAQANWSKTPEDAYVVDVWCSMKPLSYLSFSPLTKEKQAVVRALAKL